MVTIFTKSKKLNFLQKAKFRSQKADIYFSTSYNEPPPPPFID
jgi:hypothetical protein